MVTVRYFAAAREAAGCPSEQVPAGSVGELRRVLVDRHGQRMAEVLAMSSLVCDGVRPHDHDTLTADSRVDVLPPFAGG